MRFASVLFVVVAIVTSLEESLAARLAVGAKRNMMAGEDDEDLVINADEDFARIDSIDSPMPSKKKKKNSPLMCVDFFAEDCSDLDCDLLTECNWPGFNANNLGDG